MGEIQIKQFLIFFLAIFAAIIVVYIDNHPDAGRGAVDGIKIVDDVMLEHANRKR